MRTALLQSHRQQQLQIKANIKSGNFPWHRWKVTGNQQAASSNLQPTAKQTGENLPDEPTLNPSEPKRTKPPNIGFAFCVPYAGSKGFPVYAVACQLVFTSTPGNLSPSIVIVLLGKCRAHGECHVFCQANDRLNIYYLESFALLCSNLNPRVVCLQL